MEILKSHKAQQNIIKLQTGKDYNPYNLVFTNLYGYPVDFNAFSRSLKRVLNDNGLPEISPAQIKAYIRYQGTRIWYGYEGASNIIRTLYNETYSRYLYSCIDKQKKKAINKTAHLFEGLK